jgi:phage/plasmid-like protein (TIGR03299 family)
LGVVSDRYKIVQNTDAFNFLDSLLQDGVIRYESAGALKGGRVVWALARMPSQDEIAPGDVSRRYILFSTTHDGSGSVHALPTSVRVVCANTLRIATASDCGFRHTGDVAKKLEFARQYLSQFDEKFTLFRDKARVLAQRHYSPQQSRDFMSRCSSVARRPSEMIRPVRLFRR